MWRSLAHVLYGFFGHGGPHRATGCLRRRLASGAVHAHPRGLDARLVSVFGIMTQGDLALCPGDGLVPEDGFELRVEAGADDVHVHVVGVGSDGEILALTGAAGARLNRGERLRVPDDAGNGEFGATAEAPAAAGREKPQANVTGLADVPAAYLLTTLLSPMNVAATAITLERSPTASPSSRWSTSAHAAAWASRSGRPRVLADLSMARMMRVAQGAAAEGVASSFASCHEATANSDGAWSGVHGEGHQRMLHVRTGHGHTPGRWR
jgi:hypothetical protein